MHAVVLLSGGLDSTTCLALALKEGFSCHALSFSYGQRHTAELDAAKNIAQKMKVTSHHIIDIDPRPFAKSHLTNRDAAIPNFKTEEGIASTYVPARNTVFLSYALALAETLSAEAIFIGVSSVDYSGYPDCRPDFIEAFQDLASKATKASVEGQPINIRAPLLYLSKTKTIKLGMALNVDYSLTVSCYQANEQGEACGVCDSCGFRKQGFLNLGFNDPTRYVKG